MRAVYEIRLTGAIGPAAREAFADLSVEVDPTTTVVTAELDQAGLHAVLDRVRGLGLELLEVRHQPTAPRRPSRPVPGWLDRAAAVGWRVLVLGTLLAAGLWVFHLLQVLVLALLLGFAQVSVLHRVVARLVRLGLPRPLAAVVSVLALAGAFGGVLLLALRELVAPLATLPALLDRALGVVEAGLAGGPAAVDPGVLARFSEQLQGLLTWVVAALAAGLGGGASFLAGVTAMLTAGLLLAVFALADGARVRDGVERLFDADRRPAVRAAGQEALRVTGAWFAASTLTGLVDALGIGVGLWLLDVPLVVPLMVLTFLLGYVPVVGATVAGAVAVVVALAADGLGAGGAVLLVVLVVQQVESNVLAPLLLSRAVAFAPLVTLLVTAAAAVLLGALGMLLAVPVAGAAVAAVRRYHAGATAAPRP